MAGMRKLRGKWYIRVHLVNGKEKLLPTKTSDKKQAEAYKRKIEEREFYVRAKLEDDLLKSSTQLFAATDEFLSECKALFCVDYFSMAFQRQPQIPRFPSRMVSLRHPNKAFQLKNRSPQILSQAIRD